MGIRKVIKNAIALNERKADLNKRCLDYELRKKELSRKIDEAMHSADPAKKAELEELQKQLRSLDDYNEIDYAAAEPQKLFEGKEKAAVPTDKPQFGLS